MSKDRARPFSRKHRKYWLTVTGGMILIGGINVALGMCAYQPAPETVERIIPVLPPPTTRAEMREPGQINFSDVPRPVMQQFNRDAPGHAPVLARKLSPELYELSYIDRGVMTAARYTTAGARLP